MYMYRVFYEKRETCRFLSYKTFGKTITSTTKNDDDRTEEDDGDNTDDDGDSSCYLVTKIECVPLVVTAAKWKR